mgnify:CR=1 FL=1
MKKNYLYVLLIIALVVILMMLNHDNMTVDIAFAKIKTKESLIYFTFTSIGICIGTLLK